MEDFSLYTYRVGSTTNILGRPPIFYHSSELLKRGCQFASVYAVRAEDARSIEKAAGTAAGYRGTVWSRRLWVDVDSQEAAKATEAYLTQEDYDYVVYDTGGGRGLHFGILREADPSHILPARDRQWVAQNLPGSDLGLYWHLHLFRLPGAVHEKTGRIKKFIGGREGKPLVLPPYVPDSEAMGLGGLSAPAGQRRALFNCWEISSKLIPGRGVSRHGHLVSLAKALKGHGSVSLHEALWFVAEVNSGFEEPKGYDEVVRIVQWAYQTP